MKAVITGDWHIRIKPDIPEEWQLNRYRMLIRTIIELCLEHDAALFLTGDIADRNRPSLLEMQLLIELFTQASDARIDVYLISGNHEAIGQGESTFDYFVPLFQKINQHDNGQILYSLNNVQVLHYIADRICFLMIGHPALKDAHLYQPSSDAYTHILLSHFRPTVNQFIKEEVDVAKLTAPYKYTFASDIHTPLVLPGNIIYTNHPLNSSFEVKPDCGCILMEGVKGEVKWKRIPLNLPNLIQVNCSANDYELPNDGYHYYRVEIKGEPQDLRQITCSAPNVKLLKVPEVAESYVEQEDAEEIRDTTIEEGLIEYMASLGLSEQKIEAMMGVYREP